MTAEGLLMILQMSIKRYGDTPIVIKNNKTSESFNNIGCGYDKDEFVLSYK